MGENLDLSKLAIEIRPRRPWEATDLGVLMARRWWWPLSKLWLIQVLPFFMMLALLPADWLWLQYFIIWWLKPIFERPLLDFLSLSVFGETPSTKRVFKNFQKVVFRQAFSSLLWRRLSPSRSFDLPVLQLEGLSGKARTKRLAVLHRQGVTPASMLTMFGASIETAIALAVVSLAFMFAPNEFDLSWDVLYFEDHSVWVMYVVNILTLLAATAVVPFYVACGFALYLNRRIDLEGWDIEIAFKNMVAKRQEAEKLKSQRIRKNQTRKNQSSAALGVMLCLLSLGLMVGSPPSHAEGEAIEMPPFERVEGTPEFGKQQIELIKQGEKFNVKEIQKRRVFPWKDWFSWDWFDTDDEADRDGFNFEGLAKFFTWLAKYAEWLLWALVLFLIFFVVFKYRHWLMDAVNYSRENSRKKSPTVLFGMDVTEESLPDNVSASALDLLQQKRIREAFALLYRASLAQLIIKGAELNEGDTENVCLHKANAIKAKSRISQENYDYFQRLTVAWQRFAYGHEMPEESLVYSLCETWEGQWRKKHDALNSGILNSETINSETINSKTINSKATDSQGVGS